MMLNKQTLIQYSTVGSAIFILVFLMYPKTRFYLNTNLKGFRHPYPQETDEPFSDIKNRVQRDKINIQKMCSEYLSSNPEPEKPVINIQIQNMYYVNDKKKLGWCFNAKVCLILTYWFLLE